MNKSTVLDYFENKPSAVAAAIGITPGAVSQWGEVVPENSAWRIQEATKGRLRVDPSVYRREGCA